MFSKDSRHYRPVPRTLNQAFNAYARLHVSRERTPIRAKLYMFACCAAIGAGWYVSFVLGVTR
jgi:hypothetical protein